MKNQVLHWAIAGWLFACATTAQSIQETNLFPVRTQEKDLSANTIQKYEKLRKQASIAKKLTPEMEKLFEDFADGNYLSTEPGGCSWYCGGGVDKAESSSCLAPSGKLQYNATNACDWNLATAWVEGSEKQGIGERITLKLSAGANVHTLYIYNGYQKNMATFRNNARVKQMKLYINGQATSILNLKDQTGMQEFKIPHIKSSDKENIKFEFEILSVYPGDKYTDTAISEINFDGVHH